MTRYFGGGNHHHQQEQQPQPEEAPLRPRSSCQPIQQRSTYCTANKIISRTLLLRKDHFLVNLRTRAKRVVLWCWCRSILIAKTQSSRSGNFALEVTPSLVKNTIFRSFASIQLFFQKFALVTLTPHPRFDVKLSSSLRLLQRLLNGSFRAFNTHICKRIVLIVVQISHQSVSSAVLCIVTVHLEKL